jgi:hypothetical protein
MRAAAIVLALLVTLPALGANPTLDEARRQTEEARRALQVAEVNLAGANVALQRATRNFEAASSRQVQLPRQINDTNRAINDFEGQANAARKVLPALRDQSDRATNEAAARQAALTLAQKRVELAEGAVAQKKEGLWKGEQGGADYLALVARRDAARERFEALRGVRLEALGQTEAFKAMQSAAELRQAALEELKGRKEADPQKVTDAATELMKARTVVETEKRAAVAADPAAAKAYAELQAVAAELAGRRAAFEKRFATDPAITPLLDQMDAAKVAQAAAVADFKTAKVAATQAQATFKQVQGEEAGARAGLLAAQNTLARLQGLFTQATLDLRDAQDRLDVAADVRARALQARDQAQRLLREKQQQEDRLRRGG